MQRLPHWRRRAQEARLLASQELIAQAAILKLAEDYEALAVRAAERDQQFAKPPNKATRHP
jgi:hypothetical protein